MADKSDDEGHYYRATWEGKLRVLRKLGEGAHGDVLMVEDYGCKVFGAKTVPINCSAAELLEHEFKIYKHLGCIEKKVKGFPQVFKYGVDPRHGEYVLVMNRLGASLRKVMEMNGDILPFYSVLRIGCQVIRRLEYMHGKGVVHGDIKPRNLLCARDSFQKIYIVDFGLAAMYTEKNSGLHKRMTTGNRFQGTEDFASRHMHKGFSISRRDDLESLGFTLIFMMKGKLPWSRDYDEEFRQNRGRRNVLELKEKTSVEELCAGLPNGMKQYMRYVCNMDFYEEPDYPFLIHLLQVGMKELEEIGNVDNGDELDIWTNKSEKEVFMLKKNEDVMWARYEAWLERKRAGKEVTDVTEPLVDWNDQQEHETENNEGDAMEIEMTTDVPTADHSSNADKYMRCNLFKLVKSFVSSKRLLSENDEDELSTASTVQNAPVIWENVERRSLWRRFRKIFISEPIELEEVHLFQEGDDFRAASDDEDWY